MVLKITNYLWNRVCMGDAFSVPFILSWYYKRFEPRIHSISRWSMIVEVSRYSLK